MNSGAMARRRFVLQQQKQTGTNTHGEPTYVWLSLYSIGGKLEYTGGNETGTGGVQQQAIGTHKLTTHYRKADKPQPSMRLIGGGTTYEIVSVGDKDGTANVLVLGLKVLTQ